VIDKAFYKVPEQYGTVNPKLVDGGVYDNQGAHKLTQKNSSYRCDIVIISDAGDKLPFDKAYNNTFTLLLRAVDTFMTRIKHFQMVQNIYGDNEIAVSFQSIGWDLDSCISGFYSNLKNGKISKELCELHSLDNSWITNATEFKTEIIKHLQERYNYEQIKAVGLTTAQLEGIRNVGTNLTPIKKELAKNLIAHAAQITELQVRLYCPQLIQNHAI
jgi:NTE family protein